MTQRKIIYIAGPMTGLSGFNRESFALAEAAIKGHGYEVRNPACLPIDWSEYEHYMQIGMVMLSQADSIVYLPGSEHSEGVKREAAYANHFNYTECPELLADVWEGLMFAYSLNGGPL